MPSALSKARSVMVTAIKKRVLPELHTRGFLEIPQHKEPIPMWHLNRPRTGGGYDAISIIFDKKRRPGFYAMINIVDCTGVTYPWGESIPANQVTAPTLLTRVLVQKIGRGVLSLILSRWFGHIMFGFKPREDEAFNKQAAEAACAEFIACLDQAERWWKTRELGPNLVEANVGVVLRDPNAKG